MRIATRSVEVKREMIAAINLLFGIDSFLVFREDVIMLDTLDKQKKKKKMDILSITKSSFSHNHQQDGINHRSTSLSCIRQIRNGQLVYKYEENRQMTKSVILFLLFNYLCADC